MASGEIVPGVHRIDSALGDRLSSVYVFSGVDAALLFDVGVDGTAAEAVVPYLDSHGIAPAHLRWIVISHADVDHFGGLASAREAFPTANVVAHDADAAMISDYGTYERQRAREFLADWGLDEDPAVLAWTRQVTREAPVDLCVRGSETLRLGPDQTVQLLHVPGHTRGHLAALASASGCLAVADAVLGRAVPRADGTPAFPPTYRYLTSYLRTVDTIAALHPTQLLTAHYGTFTGSEIDRFLGETRAFVDELSVTLVAALAAAGPAGTTLRELVRAIGPTLDCWRPDVPDTALAAPLVGHLEVLADARMLWSRVDDDGVRVGLH